jgi:hypothetical protein
MRPLEVIAMNEEYGIEAETTSANREALDRKAEQAKARRAREAERRKTLTILNEMNMFKVRKAIGRAYRAETTTTKDGRVRRYRIRGNVASMVSWLLYWEGRGELDGGWIHKSGPEWEQETELTESMVRTARRVGRAERLWEERKHLRSDDRTVVKYRLDLWRVLQVANASEIENVEARLTRARSNPEKRDTLRRELENLKATRDDLNLIDAEEGLSHGKTAPPLI